jgi:N-sulfoglucosamine sulfohydrolase
VNIIYMHCHDAGRMLQPYGYGIPTPNLMALAKDSTLFRQAHAAAPTCSPSRAALLTGTSPHTCGMHGLISNAGKLHDPSQHLAAHLVRHGYDTALSGEQHETLDDVSSLGYQVALNPGSAFELDHINGRWEDIRDFDLRTADRAGEYLRARREQERPFFLSVGFFFPHRNYPPPADDIDPAYVHPLALTCDTAETRYDMASHMTATRMMDENVGVVLHALKESGLEDKTTVLFTVDHGPAFPEMKCTLTDGGTGVAMLLKVPNLDTVQVSDALVSQIDVFPTLCDLAGVPKPDYLEGHSMVPLLTGQTNAINDAVFSEVSYHLAYEPMRAVRTERYKLIRYYGEYPRTIWANVDDSLSKSVLLDHGHLPPTRATNMLFDLIRDPMERQNLIDHDDYAGIYAELSQKLEDWMQRTDDPLLKGRVPRRQTRRPVLPATAMSPQSPVDEVT